MQQQHRVDSSMDQASRSAQPAAASEHVSAGVDEFRLNGTWRPRAASTVAELAAELGFAPDVRGVAVAVNDAVVPRSQWGCTALAAGDRVEIVGAVQGG